MTKMTALIAALAATITFGGVTASAQIAGVVQTPPRACRNHDGSRGDCRDLRLDTREIRSDRRDIRSDRLDIRHDVRTGEGRREVRSDRRDLRRDGRDLSLDRLDRRGDLRDLRRDR